MTKKCECGCGMFVVTQLTRSTFRQDYVGNITSGSSGLRIRTVSRVCERCGKPQPCEAYERNRERTA